MEELTGGDYRLDQGFLLKFFSGFLIKDAEENSEIPLPIYVQMIGGREERDEWCSFEFTDGEFEMYRCAFLSKQPLPDNYSILKINKISSLPDWAIGENKPFLLPEIEFEIEVSGEKIGHRLYAIKPNNYLDMVELVSRKIVMGDDNFKDSLTFESPSAKVMKSMWLNRDDKFCDVSFTFSDDKERKVFAHKSVLISVSDVFEAHFNGEEYRDGGSVNLVDTSFYYFNKLLEFIYTDSVQFTTVDVAFELLYLSKKYLLSSLEYQCQTTITEHCDFNYEDFFNLISLNHKSNDEYLQDYFTTQIKEETRSVLNMQDFLKCDYETVEWILSMKDLHIDEWSLLCALYKWAFHNEVTAFCADANEAVHKDATPVECLHGLLECIHFENIDGESLQRFFRLPKLGKILKIDEMKQCAFESFLEDVGAFKRSYSVFRDFNSDYLNEVYIEILVKNDFADNFEETPLKIVQLLDGSVLGLKVKIGKDTSPDVYLGEYQMLVSITVQFLYTSNDQIENSIKVEIDAREFKCRWKRELVIGEPNELRRCLPDYREYLSDKIESTGLEKTSDSVWEKVLGFELVIGSWSDNNSD